MSTKALAKSNGTAKKPVSTVTKPVAKTKAVSKPIINLEKRIQHIAELQGLSSKRQRVVDTQNNLNNFQFSGDESAILEIKDASGNKFITSNNNLINELVGHLQRLLEAKLKELNDQIVDFQL